MEKEVPNEMISDIEDDLLHFTTIEGGRYTEQVRLLYYILCVTGSVSANAATKTLDALLIMGTITATHCHCVLWRILEVYLNLFLC